MRNETELEAYAKWRKECDARGIDPLLEQFKQRSNIDPDRAVFMSERLSIRFAKVRKNIISLDALFEWISNEKKKGHLHIIHMKIEKEIK